MVRKQTFDWKVAVCKIQMQTPDIFLVCPAVGFSETTFLAISFPIILNKEFTGLWTIFFGPGKNC